LIRPPLLVVVDDTPSVRAVISRALTEAGHDVLTASDSRSATTIIERLPTPPALVVVDLRLPNTHTEAWAVRLHQRYPQLPIVFISSFPEHPDILLPGLLLQKPFAMSTLCRVVRNVLERTLGKTPA
jgi:two-component system nitrogen regulation response regulator GlnG